MRLTIAKRIFLALTFVSVLILTMSAVATRWSFERAFLDYVAEQERETLGHAIDELASLYAIEGSWDLLRDNPGRWNDLLRRDGVRTRPERRPPPVQRPGSPPPDHLELARRFALIDGNGELIIGTPRDRAADRRMPVVVDGNTVGTISIAPPRRLTSPADQNFAANQQRTTWLVALMALAVAAGISAILARQLTRPVRSLALAVRAVADGQLEERLSDARDDELGDLARDFNQLARTLEKNRSSRRQWVADIAHELRTPLAILRGELDAINDGIRRFDQHTQKSLQAETQRLTRLVDDLHDLSVFDEGGINDKRDRIDVTAELNGVLDDAETRLRDSGISLTRDLTDEPITVTADAARLRQLFSNLLENSIRYTDAPGQLQVSCNLVDDAVEIRFADSAPAVPTQALEQLFERLYRAEASRSRNTGGSGLGLSICRSIVETHGGAITATHSAIGGLQVDIRLPLAPAIEKLP
jgi:two-component system sensor histidine kinase BaeS